MDEIINLFLTGKDYKTIAELTGYSIEFVIKTISDYADSMYDLAYGKG